MRSWLRINVVVVSGVLISVIALIGVALADISSLSPPQGVTDFATFAKQMPDPQRLAVVGPPGQELIVWIGGTAVWALPSGPSCYVFDRRGALLDWSWDSGEGHLVIDPAVNLAMKTNPVTLAQAIALTQEVKP